MKEFIRFSQLDFKQIKIILFVIFKNFVDCGEYTMAAVMRNKSVINICLDGLMYSNSEIKLPILELLYNYFAVEEVDRIRELIEDHLEVSTSI